MSEHLLFLQAAGSDFGRAHDLVHAVTEAIRGRHDEPAAGDLYAVPRQGSHKSHRLASRRPGLNPERIVERVGLTGCDRSESLIVALAAHATVATPLHEVDVDWIASAA